MLKTVSAFGAMLVASALVLPTVSQAEAPASVRVSYADLDLISATGQKALQRRIGRAADTICEVGYARESERVRAAEVCRTGAVAQAGPSYQAAIQSYRRGTVTVLDAAAVIVTAP